MHKIISPNIVINQERVMMVTLFRIGLVFLGLLFASIGTAVSCALS
jgi:hypothetical protein